MFRKTAIATLIVAFMFFGAPALTSAQDADDSDGLSSLVEQIQGLLQQVRDLQNELADLQGRQNEVRQELQEAIQLTRDLSLGMSGDDVEDLQELLSEDPEIYPEGLVTGYFGPLTMRAVQRFQERLGIDTVGRVGPQTRSMIGNLIKNQKRVHLRDLFVTDADLDDDDIDIEDDLPGMGFGRTDHRALVCHDGRTLAIASPAVRAHIAHGDTLGRCSDDSDDDSDDDDDDSDDENGEVEGKVASVNINTDKVFLIGGFIISLDDDTEIEEDGDLHSLEEVEDALDDGTTVMVEAEGEVDDSSGADEGLLYATKVKFETEEDDSDEDTTPPVISDVEIDVVGSTTVEVSWETDENTDGVVYYFTDSDFELDEDGVWSEETDEFDDSHEVELSDLDFDTEYFFIITSADAEGNETISEEYSFSIYQIDEGGLEF